MLTITWPEATEATMNIVIIFAAVIIPLDCPNNRANWPIPEALLTWEFMGAFTRGCSTFVHANVWCDRFYKS
jgi:hypothetical protein